MLFMYRPCVAARLKAKSASGCSRRCVWRSFHAFECIADIASCAPKYICSSTLRYNERESSPYGESYHARILYPSIFYDAKIISNTICE